MDETIIRILLIEDNPGDAKLIRLMLGSVSGLSFDMDVEITLQAGLERLKTFDFDVVLVDLNLPDSTGLGTLSRTLAAASNTPVIVMTETDAPQTILDTIKIGVQDYFVKSRVKPEDLSEALLRQATRKRHFSGLPASVLADGKFQRSGEATPRNIRVLVVEDNPGDVALLRRMLSSSSSDGLRFEIQHAPNLSVAVELLRNRPNLILLDLDLPDSQGLNTLKHMRTLERDVPIIVLTGMDDRQQAVQALSNGAQDYLVKGKVDSRLLGRSISRHLVSAEPGSKPSLQSSL